MSTIPQTFLFGGNTIAAAHSGPGRYRHTFGGPHDRNGTSREDCNGLLIHLLHRLDLEDPAVPIVLPGFRRLPLYYCFDFRVNTLGYRLISEDELVTYIPHDDPNVSAQETWPDENYPMQFPLSDIQVSAYPYNPTDLDDAYAWAGIFGIGKLSPADQAAAKQRAAEVMEELTGIVPETDDEFQAALSHPFLQGKPDTRCLNPDCPNHHQNGRLSTLALMPTEPVPGVHTFGPWGDDVELIFEICRLCHTIHAGNQAR